MSRVLRARDAAFDVRGDVTYSSPDDFPFHLKTRPEDAIVSDAVVIVKHWSVYTSGSEMYISESGLKHCDETTNTP
jgi:hypothetical protein